MDIHIKLEQDSTYTTARQPGASKTELGEWILAQSFLLNFILSV